MRRTFPNGEHIALMTSYKITTVDHTTVIGLSHCMLPQQRLQNSGLSASLINAQTHTQTRTVYMTWQAQRTKLKTKIWSFIKTYGYDLLLSFYWQNTHNNNNQNTAVS